MSYLDMLTKVSGVSVEGRAPQKTAFKQSSSAFLEQNEWVYRAMGYYTDRINTVTEAEEGLKKSFKEYGLEYESLSQVLEEKIFTREDVTGVFDSVETIVGTSIGRIKALETTLKSKLEDNIYRRHLFGEAGIKEVKTAPDKAKRYELSKDIYKLLEDGQELSTYDMRAKTKTLDERISSFYSSLCRMENQGLVEEVEKKKGRWPWAKRYRVYRLTEKGREVKSEITGEKERLYNEIGNTIRVYNDHIADYRGLKQFSKKLESVIDNYTGRVSLQAFGPLIDKLRTEYSYSKSIIPRFEEMARVHSING